MKAEIQIAISYVEKQFFLSQFRKNAGFSQTSKFNWVYAQSTKLTTKFHEQIIDVFHEGRKDWSIQAGGKHFFTHNRTQNCKSFSTLAVWRSLIYLLMMLLFLFDTLFQRSLYPKKVSTEFDGWIQFSTLICSWVTSLIFQNVHFI